MSKAFDSVPHDLLLLLAKQSQSLAASQDGFKVTWLPEHNMIFINLQLTSCIRVSQRSVLGPVPFHIYINDVTCVVSIIYADDIALYQIIHSPNHFILMQKNINSICWSKFSPPQHILFTLLKEAYSNSSFISLLVNNTVCAWLKNSNILESLSPRTHPGHLTSTLYLSKSKKTCWHALPEILLLQWLTFTLKATSVNSAPQPGIYICKLFLGPLPKEKHWWNWTCKIIKFARRIGILFMTPC